MAYIGTNSNLFDPTRTTAAPRDADRFSGNGSTLAFTLSRAVNKATDVEVFVENVQQEPLTAYDAVGTTLTFTGAPPSGTNNVYVVYRNFDSGAQVTVPDGSITYSKLANNIRIFTTDNLTPNGNNAVFTLSEPPADANTVMVTVDGVMQRAPVHYTTSGSTITFTSNPPAGSNVHVRHLGFRTSTTVTTLPAGIAISQPNIATPIISSPTVTGGTLTSSTLVTPAINGNVAFSNTNSWSIANTGGSTLVSVDSIGRMIRPNQPAFCAQASGLYQTTSPIPFSSAKVNTGGHFNTSTYRFTAPIAGRYIFTLHIYFDNNTSGDGYPRFKVNGAVNHGYVYMQGNADGDKTSSMTTMIQMAANDYIEVIYNGTLNYYGGPEETQFTGYLIG